jgi:hypothetical protein
LAGLRIDRGGIVEERVRVLVAHDPRQLGRRVVELAVVDQVGLAGGDELLLDAADRPGCASTPERSLMASDPEPERSAGSSCHWPKAGQSRTGRQGIAAGNSAPWQHLRKKVLHFVCELRDSPLARRETRAHDETGGLKLVNTPRKQDELRSNEASSPSACGTRALNVRGTLARTAVSSEVYLGRISRPVGSVSSTDSCSPPISVTG